MLKLTWDLLQLTLDAKQDARVTGLVAEIWGRQVPQKPPLFFTL